MVTFLRRLLNVTSGPICTRNAICSRSPSTPQKVKLAFWITPRGFGFPIGKVSHLGSLQGSSVTSDYVITQQSEGGSRHMSPSSLPASRCQATVEAVCPTSANRREHSKQVTQISSECCKGYHKGNVDTSMIPVSCVEATSSVE